MEKQTNFQVSVNPLGEKMFREVFKREVFDKEHPPPLTGVREFTVNHLFANVWSRSADDFGPNPKITLRERRLISIALLAAQGFSDQLKEHVTGAFHAEIDERELLELMIHVAHYAGWAAGSNGQKIVHDVYAENMK